jgi:HSP20 family protein
MSLIYYDPVRDFDRLFNEAFDTRFPTWGLSSSRVSGKDVLRPRYTSLSFELKSLWDHNTALYRVDIREESQNNQVVANFELPGLTKEQVKIELHNNRLTVSGEFKRDSSRKEEGWVVTER